jgi:hypothetical protein
VEPGLCATCKQSRKVTAARSTFWMCERSKTEASFPRYPRLPVLKCRGYEPLAAKEPERPAP